MKKMVLRLDDLRVDSFVPGGDPAGGGTVNAHYGTTHTQGGWTCFTCGKGCVTDEFQSCGGSCGITECGCGSNSCGDSCGGTCNTCGDTCVESAPAEWTCCQLAC